MVDCIVEHKRGVESLKIKASRNRYELEFENVPRIYALGQLGIPLNIAANLSLK